LASDPAITTIRLPLVLWRRLILQLRRQSAAVRESGSFLLGSQRGASGQVTHFICYDALDPHAYQGGAIAFHAAGYAALWQYCRQHRLEVLADVHAHPGANVRQSPIDRENPMVPVIGHTAVIVPNFARTAWWTMRSAGVYEYLGDFKWRSHPTSEKCQRIKLTLW
jgi:proteasome lid subunit RPN8/RPN11